MSSESGPAPEPTPRRGRLFIVSAPSGAGKSTLLKHVLDAEHGIEFSVSTTTRPQRPGECDGVEYHFTDAVTFKRLIDEGEFIEYARVHGNYYGTRRRTVEAALSRGADLLLDIDVQGAKEIRKQLPEAVSIFIMPPSLRALEERLRRRGTETEEQIQRRLKNAIEEIRHSKDYDYVVVNDDLATATARMIEIIRTERRMSVRRET